MNKAMRTTYGCLCVFSILLAVMPRLANANYPARASIAQSNNAANSQQVKVKSAKQAANLVKNRYKAKVLSVDSSQSKSGTVYRVKLLSKDGVMFYVLVDARTGRVSKG